MNSISSDAFERALAAQGLDAGKDSRSPAFAAAHARFRELTWNLLRRLLDLTRASSGGSKVVKAEHIRDLCKLVRMLHSPLPMCGKAKPHVQKGGHAGTVMTGSFFNPANGPDASSYSASFGAAQHATFPDASSGLIRSALSASDAFPVAVGGSGSGTTAKKACSWLTPDALGELVREYNARAGADLRIGDSARALIRKMVQAGVDSIVADACCGSKQKRVTADALVRSACRSCMCAKLFGGV